MRGLRVALGIVFGAAAGILLGLAASGELWVGVAIGSALGLLVGSVAESLDASPEFS